MNIKERLKNLLLEFSETKISFESAKLIDGTEIEYSTLEVGGEVKIKETGELAPDGEHLLEDDKTIVVTEGGKIVEIKEKVEEVVEEVIEVVEEELKEEKFEVTEEDYSNLVSALEMIKTENSSLKSEIENLKKEFESVKMSIEDVIKLPSTDSPAETIVKEEFSNSNPYMQIYKKLK